MFLVNHQNQVAAVVQPTNKDPFVVEGSDNSSRLKGQTPLALYRKAPLYSLAYDPL
jgi:hypothetical protein